MANTTRVDRAAAPPAPAAEEAERGPGRATSAPAWLQVGWLVLLAALPLVVALAAVRRGTWYPTLDRAMFELLVRDVGGPDTPLLGAYARVIVDGEQGSHLGPLGPYLMAPVYRLFGPSSWALQVATVWVHLLGIGVSVAVARRQGGARLALAVTAVVVALELGFGPATLIDPWNPYLAVFWWLAFVLAIWAVVDGDLPMLPVVVLAGSVCVQNHLEYLGLVACLGALALAATARHQIRRRRPPGDRGPRGAWAGWAGGSVGLGVLLWLPTIWEQVTRDPGNLTLVRTVVSDGTLDHLGLGEGFATLLRQLDPGRLASGEIGVTLATGSPVPGAVLVSLWGLSAVLAVRTGTRSLTRLHLVLGVGLIVGGLSMGRYQDEAWAWLGLWAPVLTGLLMVAAVWTVVPVVGRWVQHRSEARWAGIRFRRATRQGSTAAGTLVVALVGGVAVVAVQASQVENPDQFSNRWLAEAVPALVVAIDDGPLLGPGGAPRGSAAERRYAVKWRDPVGFGAAGYGLLNELDRRGYDVTTDQSSVAQVARHRVAPSADADVVIHLVVGGAIERWREAPGVREVVAIDHRSAEERARYDRLESEVAVELGRRGLFEYVEAFEVALIIGVIDERVPDEVSRRVGEMLEIGQPAAFFVGPPGAGP